MVLPNVDNPTDADWGRSPLAWIAGELAAESVKPEIPWDRVADRMQDLELLLRRVESAQEAQRDRRLGGAAGREPAG